MKGCSYLQRHRSDLLNNAPPACGRRFSKVWLSENKWRMVDGDGRAGVNKKFDMSMEKALNGDVASGPLQVRFTTTEDKLPLAICQVPCPWGRCKGGRVILEGNAAFMLDEVSSSIWLCDCGFPGPYKVFCSKRYVFCDRKGGLEGHASFLTITPTAPEGVPSLFPSNLFLECLSFSKVHSGRRVSVSQVPRGNQNRRCKPRQSLRHTMRFVIDVGRIGPNPSGAWRL